MTGGTLPGNLARIFRLLQEEETQKMEMSPLFGGAPEGPIHHRSSPAPPTPPPIGSAGPPHRAQRTPHPPARG